MRYWAIVPRLFYMPRTRSSRVLWLLAEIGAPYELTKLAPEERTSGEHLARHPLGRVPALELDDGTVIFESAAICLQLADLHPDAGLIPPLGSAERGLVYQWVLFAMTELEAPLYRWIREAAEDSADPPRRTCVPRAPGWSARRVRRSPRAATGRGSSACGACNRGAARSAQYRTALAAGSAALDDETAFAGWCERSHSR